MISSILLQFSWIVRTKPPWSWQLDVVHPQPGPGTCSYLGCDRILVFLQVRNSFSNPHVNGPYDSVYVVRSIDPISHYDQGIWSNKRDASHQTGQTKLKITPVLGGMSCWPLSRLVGRRLSFFTTVLVHAPVPLAGDSCPFPAARR